MEEIFACLHLEALTQLQEKAETDLENALLNGASWSEVKLKRRIVTDLAIEIHKRKYPFFSVSPADTPLRS